MSFPGVHDPDMTRDPRSFSRLEVTLARALLALYPRRLRRRYGEEMAELFLARLERARRSGRRGDTARVWIRGLVDLTGTVVHEITWRRRGPRTRKERRSGVGAWTQDARYAARRLARTPGFSLGALGIMAIAIGATTAVFAVVNALIFTPPPYGQPQEVVDIYQDSDEGDPNSNSYPAYQDMAAMDQLFHSVAATSPDQASMATEAGSVPVSIEFTTASFMNVIGRTPVRGRWFDPAMDEVGAGYFAVVSHHAWKARFGRDPDIVGETVRLNGSPVTVIGVGPEGYNGMGAYMVTDFFLSISSVGVNGSFRVANLDRRQDHWYYVKARLAPGVSLVQAQEAMTALAQRLAESYPELNRGRDITVFAASEVKVHPEFHGTLYSVSAVLLTVVFLVLLLASTNLGSLLLVRGLTRTPEIAVRRAMGAAPARVARLFLTEGLLL